MSFPHHSIMFVFSAPNRIGIEYIIKSWIQGSIPHPTCTGSPGEGEEGRGRELKGEVGTSDGSV